MLPAAIILIALSGIAVAAGYMLGFIGMAVAAGLFAAANMATVVVAMLWSGRLLQAEYRTRLQLQGQLSHYAAHDALTGLANRAFFMEQLARRAALADRGTGVPFAVCSLAIDGFSRIQEQSEQDISDGILVKVAEVLHDCVRASDLVARLDGGRFGILLEGITEAKGAHILAQRIVSSVPRVLAETGTDIPVNVSIGMILRASGQDLPADMMREADAALREAKKKGPGRFELTAFAP